MSVGARRAARAGAALALLACACAGSGATPESLRAEREVLGLRVAVEARDPDARRARRAFEAAFAAAERTGRMLLAAREGSEVRTLNDVPSRVAIEVSLETADALRRALAIAEETGGAYDPTAPPLLHLWGLDAGAPRVPRDFEIEMALRQVSWGDVDVDEERPVVQRLSRRTRVDLDGFAVGACADAAAASLREAQVPAARVSVGRTSALYGGTPERPWRVAVGEEGGPVAELRLQGGAVAEARPEERLTAPDGTSVHDLIDPRDGRPATGARWAAVAAGDAASAAAFARAVFAMGGEGAAFLAERPSLRGAGVLASGEHWASPQLEVEWR